MIEVLCAGLSGLASVLVAVVSYRINKTSKETAKRADRRKEESMLSLEMMVACIELTEVCANALTGGHNNGNVEVARKNVECAKEKYKEFQRSVIFEEIA